MARRVLDAYYTGREAVASLRSRVLISGTVLEPCHGKGAITRCFPDCSVVTNDIDPACFADTCVDARVLTANGVDWTVTNPPFSDAFEILQNFHRQRHRIAMLLRLSFLEPTVERAAWLAQNPPSGIIVLPRYSYTGNGKTDSVTSAWLLWNTPPLTPAIQIAAEFKSMERQPRRRKRAA